MIAGFDYRDGNLQANSTTTRFSRPSRLARKEDGSEDDHMPDREDLSSTRGEEARADILLLQGNPSVRLFDGGNIGSFVAMVCYDFLDMERIAMYRGKVTISSSSRSTRMQRPSVTLRRRRQNGFLQRDHMQLWAFRRIARRLTLPSARAPDDLPHSGASLATAQVIEVPVSNLDKHQHLNYPQSDGVNLFKSLRLADSS